MLPPRLLQVPKASDVLAEDLMGRMARGELTAGDLLPSERALVEQTGLSRTSVREALRILEVRGLLTIRAGRGGGAVVRHPGASELAASARIVVRGSAVSLRSMLQTRIAVEPSCVALAVSRGDADALDALDACNHALAGAREVSHFLRANAEWHVAMVRATGNELLVGLVEALAEATYDARGAVGRVDLGVRCATSHAHRAITAAVRDGDADLARRRMVRHLEAYLADMDDAHEVVLDWTGASEVG